MSTVQLARFLSGLRYEDLPRETVERTKELFLDWVGSALAGRDAPPVRVLEGFAAAHGPSAGPSEILVSRQCSSPFFAALVNGASSHVVEQDDVHNGSVVHPAAVVFPAALAVAQETRASGKLFLTASVAGYEAVVRVGAFLGRSHYKYFHTTGTAGTLGAAAAAGRLLGASAQTMTHALGSAGTQAAGLWEFLRDGADSKQLHTAKAAADGLMAAYLTRDGFTGAGSILEGDQGMGAGMSSDPHPEELVRGLGDRWAVCETSFKFHASCRHTHPAADALLQCMRRNGLDHTDLKRVTARVHQAALDVLGAVTTPQTVHQSKFSMGFVLALIARDGRAGVSDFSEQALGDPQLRALSCRVEMVLDPRVDAAYPERWTAVVEVETHDGRRFSQQVLVPKGDPGNPLTPGELEAKVLQLARYRQGATAGEMERVMERIRQLERVDGMSHLLPWKSSA